MTASERAAASDTVTVMLSTARERATWRDYLALTKPKVISLLLWMSPWAGVVLADFFVVRRGHIDVPELYREPERSAYGTLKSVCWIRESISWYSFS